ncbi:UpxY family transcription antiterminator [uncultured Bacteroides sp.]|uniref:UpxY family transcription antiterminator n=1 Tax=uncultured Bacteroides sp. TaxID=162156 RepID=UPI002AA7BB1A|nr:UpxY family transcription antiterminator [uncultured Bacteroides sp.]
MYAIQSAQWFVLRTNYSRELKVMKQLADKNIQCFIPMKYKNIIKDEQRKRIKVPYIHNMVFVNIARNILDSFIAQSDFNCPVSYMKKNNSNEPIIIPQQEMNNFMLVAGCNQENLIFLNDGIEKFAQSDQVRVIGGLLEGLEGYVVRIRRDRKVVVSLQGVVAVAISGIHPSLLEKIH